MRDVERRRRALASDRRAGSYLRRRATEQQLEFLRSNWRAFLYLVVLWAVVLANLWWPVFDRYRGFLAGWWTATVIWVGVLGVWQMSGVGHLQLGSQAEQWTAQELRTLRKRGWLLINNAKLKRWDIDHVLVGPGGVVVVETKGGRTDWSAHRWEHRLRQAAQQASRNAGDTRRLIKNITRDAPVRAAVALWPSGKANRAVIDDVDIVPGLELCEWVESFPSDALEARQIEEAWERIAGTVEGRDRHDLEVAGPPPRTFDDWAIEIAQHLGGAAAGFLMLGPMTRFGGVPYGLLAHLGVGAASAIVARRVAALRLALNAVALGSASAVLVLAIVLARLALW